MPGRPLHTVVETPEFRRRVRDLLGEEELKALIDHLAAEPDAGEVMPGTGAPGSSAGEGRAPARVAAFA